MDKPGFEPGASPMPWGRSTGLNHLPLTRLPWRRKAKLFLREPRAQQRAKLFAAQRRDASLRPSHTMGVFYRTELFAQILYNPIRGELNKLMRFFQEIVIPLINDLQSFRPAQGI